VLENFRLAANQQCCGGAREWCLLDIFSRTCQPNYHSIGWARAVDLSERIGKKHAGENLNGSTAARTLPRPTTGLKATRATSRLFFVSFNPSLDHIDHMRHNEITLVMTHDHALDYHWLEALLIEKTADSSA